MPCSSCQQVKPVPVCWTTLNIGDVAAATAHKVYLKNISTGRELVYAITSQADGTLRLVRADDTIKVIPGWYEIKAVLNTSENVSSNVNITVDSVAYECLLVRFTEVYDTALALEDYGTITVSV